MKANSQKQRCLALRNWHNIWNFLFIFIIGIFTLLSQESDEALYELA